ncbi:MAG: hypothetical protein EOP06_22045 [Proteobacteria bacterium]|nr:MAG: hypothetical protein EOP06_22045 [Pseudomonadota bacterium]
MANQRFKSLTGINVQWPWSELLINSKKTIETRTYRMSDKLKGVELALIETPGPRGKRDAGILKARIIGTIIFGESYQYESKKHWIEEFEQHQVPLDDEQYEYEEGDVKWAWTVVRVEKLDKPVQVPAKRGIVFAKNCKVPIAKRC